MCVLALLGVAFALQLLLDDLSGDKVDHVLHRCGIEASTFGCSEYVASAGESGVLIICGGDSVERLVEEAWSNMEGCCINGIDDVSLCKVLNANCEVEVGVLLCAFGLQVITGV